jgi:L-ribulose-5-phosphate 3-epimerase
MTTVSRRAILAALAAGAASRAQQIPPVAPPDLPQGAPDGPRVPRPRTAPKPRTTPPVCLYSQHLVKVEYEAVGMILREMGFDGCDMAVMPGSHITSGAQSTDFQRAIEAVNGTGMEVFIVTMPATNANDMNGRQILSVAGFMGVPLFRPGYWRYGNAADPETRLSEVQREMLSLASVGRAYNMTMAVHNGTGDAVGAGMWDMSGLLRGVDSHWVGYDFDPGNASLMGGANGATLLARLAAPKLKAVTVRDYTWRKDGGSWKPAPCPLGEGIVDWKAFFAVLAKAKFLGPVTIEVRYETQDELNAFRRDLEFVRKAIAAAYGA